MHQCMNKSNPAVLPVSRHIAALDGLRGMAILSVIVFHYFYFFPVFSFGWSGVDLFFVLSGYLISGRLLEKLGKPGYFQSFYYNRTLRIFPLYYGFLTLFFTASLLFAKNSTVPLLSYYFTHWKSFYLFTENWTFINCGLPTAPYLQHFWSLATEEQFYLIWPALICILSGSRKRIRAYFLLLLLSVITRCIIFAHHQDPGENAHYYYNTFCRIDAFVMGALVCEIRRSGIRIGNKTINLLLLSSLMTLAAGILFFGSAANFSPFMATAGYTIIAVFYACLLYKSVDPHTIIGTIFSNRLLQYCGKISYGLYIFHLPVLLIFEKRISDLVAGGGIENPSVIRMTAILLCLFISFLISALSFRYFELFFLRLKKK